MAIYKDNILRLSTNIETLDRIETLAGQLEEEYEEFKRTIGIGLNMISRSDSETALDRWIRTSKNLLQKNIGLFKKCHKPLKDATASHSFLQSFHRAKKPIKQLPSLADLLKSAGARDISKIDDLIQKHPSFPGVVSAIKAWRKENKCQSWYRHIKLKSVLLRTLHSFCFYFGEDYGLVSMKYLQVSAHHCDMERDASNTNYISQDDKCVELAFDGPCAIAMDVYGENVFRLRQRHLLHGDIDVYNKVSRMIYAAAPIVTMETVVEALKAVRKALPNSSTVLALDTQIQKAMELFEYVHSTPQPSTVDEN
eukprot:GILK01001843.1.p2 GENE.GILK01001843.1~~GILK01001843.1.p2  ORF type:complete len:310 (+),score=48.35 GILK01001843.1:2125-3054(+)